VAGLVVSLYRPYFNFLAMNTTIQHIRTKASEKNKKVVFPRSSDPRVIKAAKYLHHQKICEVILVENKNAPEIPSHLEVVAPHDNENTDAYAELFFKRRKHKGITKEDALRVVQDPLYFASCMIASGDADCGVAGSVSTTGDVLRAAIQTIGLKPGSKVVSSTFLMNLANGRALTYADCGVVPYPDTDQLATIASDSAKTHQQLTGEKPVVAMLSFSTKGSAEHDRIDLVRDALEIVKANNPDLLIDGELQFDAAYVPEVAKRKAPSSKVAGKANVFIFPNLDAGNIAYKITERIGGADATGPIVQGLAKPMMDLSRGCGWEDIVNAACVSVLLTE